MPAVFYRKSLRSIKMLYGQDLIFFDGEDFAACCDNREDILPRISAIVPLLMYLDKNEKDDIYFEKTII